MKYLFEVWIGIIALVILYLFLFGCIEVKTYRMYQTQIIGNRNKIKVTASVPTTVSTDIPVDVGVIP